MLSLDRRTLITTGLALAALPLTARAGPPGSGRLSFAVFRNGHRIGEHQLVFSRTGDGVKVVADARMTVKVGPVPVFRYTHHSEERWTGAQLDELETRTSSNGKIETVTAERAAGAISIESLTGKISAPASAAPFSHWNSAVMDRPLFNPQTGKLLKVTTTRAGSDQVALASGAMVAATRWRVRGETEIDDWYDGSGVWVALKGVLKDKSVMEYRRT